MLFTRASFEDNYNHVLAVGDFHSELLTLRWEGLEDIPDVKLL